MPDAGLGSVHAVTEVLLPKRSQAVPRDVQRRHLGQANESAAALPDTRCQLRVLVDRPRFVPPLLAYQRAFFPNAGEARVDVVRFGRVTPEPRCARAGDGLER